MNNWYKISIFTLLFFLSIGTHAQGWQDAPFLHEDRNFNEGYYTHFLPTTSGELLMYSQDENDVVLYDKYGNFKWKQTVIKNYTNDSFIALFNRFYLEDVIELPG